MRLTRLEFRADPDFRSLSLAMMRGVAHQKELLLVLRQVSALVSLRYLSLSGVGSKEAQALDSTVTFSLLEELHLLECTVEASDGLINFLDRSRSLAAVGVHEVLCVGTRSALVAFKEALEERIGSCTSVNVQFWVCREPCAPPVLD